ncbi:MAG: FMN-binding protein [Acidimicrobiales bacterium]
MKRYPFVIGATVASLAGVLAYHTPSTATVTPVDSGTHGAATSGGSASTTAPSGSAPTTAPSGSAPTTAPTTAAPATRSATGAAEQYGYGQLSVTVTISGGTITSVAIATLQVAEPRSAQIAQSSVPVLEREVLAAQSATINAVSGATYTSEAYARSVQSALDQLGK